MHIRIKCPTKKKVIMCLVAFVLVFFVIFVALIEEKKEYQYDIVVLGDSIVGNNGYGNVSFTAYLGERLGKTAFKGGIGGTTMSRGITPMWPSVSSVEWCMIKIAEAISFDDWDNLTATMAYADSYNGINEQTMSYFATTMDTLSRIDFSQVEILIIEHGTNDYNSGKKLDNPNDMYDTTTFGGALRRSLKIIRKAYPDLRIVLMSPLYCELGAEREKKGYNTKYGDGGYLDEYVELEKQIAQEFEVEWIDAYHNSGIGEENAHLYLPDGLHLNAEGHKQLADFLADYLQAD